MADCRVALTVLSGKESGEVYQHATEQAQRRARGIAMSLGVRGGPDGMLRIVYAFGLGFLFWWIVIDLVWSIWRWIANPD